MSAPGRTAGSSKWRALDKPQSEASWLDGRTGHCCFSSWLLLAPPGRCAAADSKANDKLWLLLHACGAARHWSWCLRGSVHSCLLPGLCNCCCGFCGCCWEAGIAAGSPQDSLEGG